MKQTRISKKKQMLSSKTLRLTVLFTLLFACAGCGGLKVFGKGSDAGKQSHPTEDITRPPVVAKSARQAEEVLDPDETVSYERWKQKQATADEDE